MNILELIKSTWRRVVAGAVIEQPGAGLKIRKRILKHRTEYQVVRRRTVVARYAEMAAAQDDFPFATTQE
jgi:hypothetical protein